MSDDEDPFEAFETPDGEDDEDPFADLADAATEAGAEDGDPETTADDPPLDGGPDDERDTQPGRLPDDPFDRVESEPGGTAPDTTDDGEPSSESDPVGDGDTADTSSSDPDPAAPTDDPFTSFSDVSVDEREDPFAAFESAGVEGVDPDVVWESLSAAGVGETAVDDEKEYTEVSKHRFCERCEHFSGPPDVHCTYEGAAIVEFLDMETVRLVNCPIVAEQRALDEGGTDLD